MNDTCTVCERYIVGAGDIICLFALLSDDIEREIEERLVFFIFELLALVFFDYLIGRNIVMRELAENAVEQSLCHIIGVAVCRLYLDICFAGIYAERDIGGKSPRSCRPCEEICVLALYFEADDCGAFLDILIALSDFGAGERCAAAGTVGNYLESLIEQTLVPYLAERPPFGFDIFICICDIGMLHISPEADYAGEILPHALVFPYALAAFLYERLDAVFFYLILAVQPEQLFHFKLNGKPVCIPACLAENFLALHCLIAGNHIFDYAREHMTYMRLSVCRRGSVIECIIRTALACFDTLFEYLIVTPELLDLFFSFHEIEIRGHFFVHEIFPPE